MATMSKTPVYFHREQKEMKPTPKLPGCSVPHLLIAYTWQLEILVTSLPWVAAFYMSRIDCLELILFLFYLCIPKKFITFLIAYFCTQIGQTKVVVYRLTKKSLSRPATAMTSPTCSKSASPSRFKAFINSFRTTLTYLSVQ